MLKPHRPKHDVPAPPILWDLEMTTGQVAQVLRTSHNTIHKWCVRDGLPHRKAGAHRRIIASDLRDWLRQELPNKPMTIACLNPTARRRIAAFVGGNTNA